MKGILIKSFVCAAISLYFAPIATASSAVFNNLIVFGDSLSDAASLSTEPNMAQEKEVGNNYWVKAQGKVGAPITSENSITKNHPIWPNDLIVNSILFDENPNHTRFIYPSRQASQLGYSSLRYSVDYAWASAETGNHYVNDLQLSHPYNDQACSANGPGLISPESSCAPGVLLQIKQYLNDVQNHPNPHTLFIIWAGGNDFFNNMKKIVDQNKQDSKSMLLLKMLNAPFPLISATAENDPLSNAIKNLKQAVIMLIQSGVPAQNIYVVNLPNLADTPAAQSFVNGRKSMRYMLVAMTETYNFMLRSYLVFNYLHASFNLPNGNIISVNAEFSDILKNHQRLGFDKLLQSCVQEGATPYCHGYMFFNEKHPTTKAHELLAKYIESVVSVRETAL